MTERSHSAILVERARSGQADAIAELYRRYGRMMFRTAYRLLRSTADAEDTVQDVFVGLTAALREYQHREQLEDWLRTLTVRASLMSLRTQRRRREVGFDHPEPDPAVTDSSALIDQIALERALDRLPGDLREVFVLKVMEGYSHVEIAALLGISESHSRQNLHRARQYLVRKLRSTA